MSLCQECSQYHNCRSLCPEAEVYVNQDNVAWSETRSVYTDQDRQKLQVFDLAKGRDQPLLSEIERAVLCRLGAGMTRAKISEDLCMTRHNVKTICLRLKGKAAQI